MDRINSLEEEISDLRKVLLEKEKELYKLKKEWISIQKNGETQAVSTAECQQFTASTGNSAQIGDRLPKWAIERYSRQILLPEIGVAGQEKLCAAKVLIVGAGGLGCPAAMYLAGAGVGEIGIVDYDTVELTNIHRQTLHGESDQGAGKVHSAADTLRGINSRITVTPYNMQLDSSNALEVMARYDLVLDCSDNVPTRYMLNDACVLTKLPLISGSALKMEGQITIYGYRTPINPKETESEYRGPCYRCMFPTPPPPEAVGSCSSQGVAGPVPGVIGALQALEAMKYIVGHSHQKLLVEKMLLFDGEDMTFRSVRLRARSAACAACGAAPGVARLLDYEHFCRARAKEKKREAARLKSQRRKAGKQRRMTGQSYLGYRTTDQGNRKWLQDVPKSERKLGPPCTSDYCKRTRNCADFTDENRHNVFTHFWNDLDWKGKKKYVRSLVDTVPPKRRRAKNVGGVSRKCASKLYHLLKDEKRLSVCRIMFLNTLGVKEGTVCCWVSKEDVPKTPKKPIKALNVDSYIATLPKSTPKCQYCRDAGDIQYVDLDNIKNLYQLYNQYVAEMKCKNISPASRKTFSKVFSMKNLRIFKAKKEGDVCDIDSQHNTMLHNYSIDNIVIDIVRDSGVTDNVVNEYFYNEW